MATVTKYSFNKSVDIPSLVIQIQASSIVTVLDHIDVTGDETDVWFKDALSDADQSTLNSVMANYAPIPAPPSPPSEVVTQFEKRDKTIKLAHAEGDVAGDGTVTVFLKVPGTPGSADGRWLSSGTAFFDSHTPGDKVIAVYFTDEDNILGNGAGSAVGSYTDDEAPEQNRGWAIPPVGFVKAEAIGGYGFAPAGFYVKVIAKKAGESPSGKFYCNIEWGKKE